MDSLGQVTNVVPRWSDNAPVSAQQYGYAFDDIGNRKTAAVGGGAGVPPAAVSSYSANLLNQYESRTVPVSVDVTGLATNAATVTVNNQVTTRHGDYFHAQVSTPNTTAPVYRNLGTVGVLKNAGSNRMDIVATKTGTVFVAQSPEQFTHDADGNVTSDGRCVTMSARPVAQFVCNRYDDACVREVDFRESPEKMIKWGHRSL